MSNLTHVRRVYRTCSHLKNRHPATTWNQKKIWEAEQKDAKRKRDEEAANKELVRESDRRRYEHMAGNKCEPDASSQSLNFMYAPPPGYQQVNMCAFTVLFFVVLSLLPPVRE